MPAQVAARRRSTINVNTSRRRWRCIGEATGTGRRRSAGLTCQFRHNIIDYLHHAERPVVTAVVQARGHHKNVAVLYRWYALPKRILQQFAELLLCLLAIGEGKDIVGSQFGDTLQRECFPRIELLAQRVGLDA